MVSTSLNSNKVYHFSGADHLQQKLEKYKISPSGWKGVSVENLYEEWKKGECIFEKANGSLIRKVSVVSVHCFHTNQKGERFRLSEEKQIMPDGSERKRGYKFVSETMKPDESPELGAKRGVSEELQIDDPELNFERIPELDENKMRESSTYIGLKTQYTVFHFKTEIPIRLFKESYEEVEENILTIFKWEKI